jgi:hypothetical protein
MCVFILGPVRNICSDIFYTYTGSCKNYLLSVMTVFVLRPVRNYVFSVVTLFLLGPVRKVLPLRELNLVAHYSE